MHPDKTKWTAEILRLEAHISSTYSKTHGEIFQISKNRSNDRTMYRESSNDSSQQRKVQK